MKAILTVAHLTLTEARRRRVLLAAFLLAAAFVALFALGLYLIVHDAEASASPVQLKMIVSVAVTMALYAANFLIVMTAVLVTVDTLAGEIASGVIETLCTKPVSRRAIGLGKWLGCLVILSVYAFVLCGGVLLAARLIAGYRAPHVAAGLALILLEGTVLLTLTVAGGARLSTLTNGITVFGLYGLAFIGGWMEQIGTFVDNSAARYVGIAASLLVPSESLWRLASYWMQPALIRDLNVAGPFATPSVPSTAMLGWACAHVLLVLGLALRWFRRRDL